MQFTMFVVGLLAVVSLLLATWVWRRQSRERPWQPRLLVCTVIFAGSMLINYLLVGTILRRGGYAVLLLVAHCGVEDGIHAANRLRAQGHSLEIESISFYFEGMVGTTLPSACYDPMRDTLGRPSNTDASDVP